jgi:hypothetical protein
MKPVEVRICAIVSVGGLIRDHRQHAFGFKRRNASLFFDKPVA